MKQLTFPFIRPDLEDARQQITHTEDMLEEQPGGPAKFDNLCRIDRAKEVLFSAESNSFRGYNVGIEIQLIHHLLELVTKNIRP
jgi:hypothetical protein